MDRKCLKRTKKDEKNEFMVTTWIESVVFVVFSTYTLINELSTQYERSQNSHYNRWFKCLKTKLSSVHFEKLSSLYFIAYNLLLMVFVVWAKYNLCNVVQSICMFGTYKPFVFLENYFDQRNMKHIALISTSNNQSFLLPSEKYLEKIVL